MRKGGEGQTNNSDACPARQEAREVGACRDVKKTPRYPTRGFKPF